MEKTIILHRLCRSKYATHAAIHLCHAPHLPTPRVDAGAKLLKRGPFIRQRGAKKSKPNPTWKDNINCMIAGEKRFYFMHPSYKDDFEVRTGVVHMDWCSTPPDVFGRTALKCPVGAEVLVKTRETGMG